MGLPSEHFVVVNSQMRRPGDHVVGFNIHALNFLINIICCQYTHIRLPGFFLK